MMFPTCEKSPKKNNSVGLFAVSCIITNFAGEMSHFRPCGVKSGAKITKTRY